MSSHLHQQSAFLALADALPHLVALVQEAQILYVNPAGARMLGRLQADLVGSTARDVGMVLPDTAPSDRGSRRSDRVETRITWTWLPLEHESRPALLVQGHEVSGHARNEEHARDAERLDEASPSRTRRLHWVVDEEWRFVDVGDALLEELGRARDEVLRTSSHEMFTTESRARLVDLLSGRASPPDSDLRDIRLWIRRSDGLLLDVSMSAVRAHDERGHPAGWRCEARALTEIDRARTTPRAREESFRRAFENAAVGKAMVSPDLRFLEVNRAYREMFGYSDEELRTMSPLDLSHPDDDGAHNDLIRRILEGERDSGRVLKKYRHKCGRLIWGDLTLTLMRDARGEPSFFLGEVTDLTESKQTERRLRDSESKLAEAQRVAHIGSWEHDIVADRSTWSAELYRIFGLDPERFTPSMQSAFARFHRDDVARVEHHVRQAIEGGEPFEFEARFHREDGEIRVLQSIGRAEKDHDGNVVRLYGVAQDVTERKRAEEALRASEGRFQSLYTQAPVLMTAFGPDGRLREASDYWLSMMGYEREEVLGRDGKEFVTQETHARIVEAFERSMLVGETVIRNLPVTGVRKDGSTLDALVTNVLETDAQGRVVGVITVGVDVSDLRRAEEAVRESEARYRALVDHAPEAIAVVDAELGVFTDVNEGVVRMFGHPRERIVGSPPTDFAREFQPDGRPSAEVARIEIEDVLAGGTPRFEWAAVHASGRDMLLQVRLSMIPFKGRQLIRSSIEDVTEWKLLQAKARHDDRMSAIGVLAAGVAHEIGNPLLALSMAAQSLGRRAPDEYAQKKLVLMREHIERISKIVRQMSDLARPRVAQRAACDLNRVVERTLEIVRYDQRAKSVVIRFDPREELPWVLAVEDQLLQVCLNLGLNALDAIATNPPERPRTLRIVTSLVERGTRSFVRATFVDSGPGIPESARSRVFQPFFTTKAPGKGTGLGLSVSQRIVEEHQGVLGFDCDAVTGTAFYFELPAKEHP